MTLNPSASLPASHRSLQFSPTELILKLLFCRTLTLCHLKALHSQNYYYFSAWKLLQIHGAKITNISLSHCGWLRLRLSLI